MDPKGSFIASLICGSTRGYARRIVDRQLTKQPDAEVLYGDSSSDLAADTEVRLGYLAEALAAGTPELFFEQVAWVKVLAASRDVPLEILSTNVQCMAEVLAEVLPEEHRDQAVHLAERGLEEFARAPNQVGTYLDGDKPLVGLARQFFLAVLETREQDAIQMVLKAAEQGTSVRDIQQHVFQLVQAEVGRMWQMNEVTIAEEHYCTEVITKATTLLAATTPLPEWNGKTVIACSISNDLHDLGIRMVAQSFEAAGWKSMFLGANVPTTALIEAVRDFGADLISLSVSIVLHVRQTADCIQTLHEHPITASVPILVGGRVFNQTNGLWQAVGADGFVDNLAEAPDAGLRLVSAT